MIYTLFDTFRVAHVSIRYKVYRLTRRGTPLKGARVPAATRGGPGIDRGRRPYRQQRWTRPSTRWLWQQQRR